MTKISKMAKNHFSGVQNGYQSVLMWVLGGYLNWKVVLEFWFGHPKCHFRCPKNAQNGCFWLFWGYRKWHFGCPNQNSKTTFQYKYPPFSHFGNHFRPRKSDFWPFYWFWSFSHWNSHWSRKILRTAEGRVVHHKQKLFWKSETKRNNLKPCRN